MMRCVLGVLICMLITLSYTPAFAEEIITFPDPNFELFVREAVGKPTGDLFASDVQTGFLTLDVSGRDIADLTGLSHFTGTKLLYCESNRLTALDLSQNPLLELVACSFNQLTELDISQNGALWYLACYENLLTELDVSQNLQLKWLNCAKNYLTSEDDIAGLNRFVTTDVYFLPQYAPYIVTFLDWNGTLLAEVSVVAGGTAAPPVPPERTGYTFTGWSEPIDRVTSNLTVSAVYEPSHVLSLPDPQFEAAVRAVLGLPQGDIGLADVAELTELDLSWCGITDLRGIAQFPALQRLDCSYNQLTELDVSGNAALTELRCDGNALTALDVRHNGALSVLTCDANRLTALAVGHNPALTVLRCAANELTELDVVQNPQLAELDCSRNQLTALDVRQNTALALLNCDENRLSALLLPKQAAITTLRCRVNRLTALDLAQSEALELLDCDDNRLAALDVTAATALSILSCRANQLRSLDVSQNTALEILRCGDNRLTSLALAVGGWLRILRCEDNLLTALDVRSGVNLTELHCQGNALTTLDVTNNRQLAVLDCSRNYLASRRDVVGFSAAVTQQLYFDPQYEIMLPPIDSNPAGGGGFAPEPAPPSVDETAEPRAAAPDFDDVPRTHWAAVYIYGLRDLGIVSGVGDGTFQPAAQVTRAAFVKLLAGVAGADLARYSGSEFDDVAPDAWYAPHVAWAAEVGVTTGVPGGGFAPDAPITRQDLAVMLARFAGAQAIKLPQAADAGDFTDADAIAPYAAEAVALIRRAGILSGYPDGTFRPQNPAGRDETCKILAVLHEIAAKQRQDGGEGRDNS